MDDMVRVFCVGVGGQGVLLASRLIGETALLEGLRVSMSEVHGMAQRGGVVETSVVLGKRYSPVLSDGEADIMLAFEPLEALRGISRCHSESVIVVNSVPIPPFTVTQGGQVYPEIEEIEKHLKDLVSKTFMLDALRLARDAGSERSLNVVMVGIVAGMGCLPLKKDSFFQTIKKLLPPNLVEVNIKSFDLGYVVGRELTG